VRVQTCVSADTRLQPICPRHERVPFLGVGMLGVCLCGCRVVSLYVGGEVKFREEGPFRFWEVGSFRVAGATCIMLLK